MSDTPAKTNSPRGGKKRTTDWGALAAKPATAPKDEIEREEAGGAARAAAAPSDQNVRVTPTGKIAPVVKAATFRLPLDALQVIEDAKADAAAKGDKLTKDAAVAEALRAWGRANQRRREAR